MGKPFVVLIAGGTASGKSTITDALLERLGSRATCLRIDSYYRDQAAIPITERAKANYDHPDSIEFSLLIEHVRALCSGRAVKVPVYDFSTHTRDLTQYEQVSSKEIIIIEGILALYEPALCDLADLKVFVDAPAEVRFGRRLERDVAERGRTPESVKAQWELTVEPMYQLLCAPTQALADLRLDGTDLLEVGLAKIIGEINIQPC